MDFFISHDRQQETPEAKARWFQSLTIEERMEIFCAITDFIFEINPIIVEKKHAQPIEGRICVLTEA
jgi:hypothetical protein